MAVFSGRRAESQQPRFDKKPETGFFSLSRKNEKVCLMRRRPQRLDAQIEKLALEARLNAESRLAAGERPKLARLLFNPSLVFLRAFVLEHGFLAGAPGYIGARTAQLRSFLTESLHFQLAGARAKAPETGLSPSSLHDAALPLSATIICKDEGDYIGKCLASLAGFAEIVVVDSGSTDATLEIVRDFSARGWPIKLIERGWPGYARQKQFAWEQATQDWVLSIDSDEWLDDDLRGELPALLQAPNDVVGWRLRRPLALYGQEKVPPKNTKPERILRLARREKVRFDDSALVHEGLQAEGKVLEACKGLLRHDRALRMDQQILKEATYARLKARQRFERGARPSRLKMIVNPLVYFLRVFFLNRMFLYGVDGYILAKTRAAYSLICETAHYQLWWESESKD